MAHVLTRTNRATSLQATNLQAANLQATRLHKGLLNKTRAESPALSLFFSLRRNSEPGREHSKLYLG
jgi:hypothetical protein